MRAMTMPNMFREDLLLSREDPKHRTRGKWKRLPQNMGNHELRGKLCDGSTELCRKCVCLDKCLFGQIAMERGI